MNKNTLDRSPKDETVIIVHGIWMQGVMMKVLAWRLKRFGYKTRTVSYPFLSQSPEENASVLAAALARVDTPVVHWAAHSLGGVVWLHFINSGVELPAGRTVLLGSPVQGSETASRMHQQDVLRPLLGRAVEGGLLGGAPKSIGERTVGLIRGAGWFSLSRLLIGHAAPSDGVVLHTETELDGVADITEVPFSHSMMLFSAETAQRAAEFFAHGEFDKS